MAAGGEPGAGSGEELDAASDEALARQVQGGDERALERLVRRYLRPIRVIVTSYLAEPADGEDAAQETFLRAIRAIESYDPERPFAPWLYQIARNVARNHVSARARWQAETPSTTLPSRLPGPDVVGARRDPDARARGIGPATGAAADGVLPRRRRRLPDGGDRPGDGPVAGDGPLTCAPRAQSAQGRPRGDPGANREDRRMTR